VGDEMLCFYIIRDNLECVNEVHHTIIILNVPGEHFLTIDQNYSDARFLAASGGSRLFLLWAWQPQAAMPTAKNPLRTTEGGEES